MSPEIFYGNVKYVFYFCGLDNYVVCKFLTFLFDMKMNLVLHLILINKTFTSENIDSLSTGKYVLYFEKNVMFFLGGREVYVYIKICLIINLVIF